MSRRVKRAGPRKAIPPDFQLWQANKRGDGTAIGILVVRATRPLAFVRANGVTGAMVARGIANRPAMLKRYGKSRLVDDLTGCELTGDYLSLPSYIISAVYLRVDAHGTLLPFRDYTFGMFGIATETRCEFSPTAASRNQPVIPPWLCRMITAAKTANPKRHRIVKPASKVDQKPAMKLAA